MKFQIYFFFFFYLNMLQCFFPQNVAHQLQTPLFIINAAYDHWQVSFIILLINSFSLFNCFCLLNFEYLHLNLGKEHFGPFYCWSYWSLDKLQSWYEELHTKWTQSSSRSVMILNCFWHIILFIRLSVIFLCYKRNKEIYQTFSEYMKILFK